MEVNPQDLIDVLTLQRNAALDEIVRQAAIIKALEREINGKPEEIKTGSTD